MQKDSQRVHAKKRIVIHLWCLRFVFGNKWVLNLATSEDLASSLGPGVCLIKIHLSVQFKANASGTNKKNDRKIHHQLLVGSEASEVLNLVEKEISDLQLKVESLKL